MFGVIMAKVSVPQSSVLSEKMCRNLNFCLKLLYGGNVAVLNSLR